MGQIHDAAGIGDLVKVAELLAADSSLIASEDDSSNFWMPLHIASACGNKDMIELLLNSGADIDAATLPFCYYTPLHLAVNGNHISAVAFLLSRGADPGKALLHKRPFHDAAESGRVKLVELFLNNGVFVDEKDITLQMKTNPRGSVKEEVVSLLLSRKAGECIKHELDWTCLHLASNKGHIDVVKLLLDRGADVNAKTSTGKTPLHLAVRNSHLDVVSLLLQSGAMVNVTDDFGYAPLDMLKMDFV